MRPPSHDTITRSTPALNGYDVAGWLVLAAEVGDLFGADMANEPGFRASLLRNVARGTAFCVRLDGEVAGAMMFNAGRIGWLAVAGKHRRRGIARALVAHAQAEGRDVRVTTFGHGHPHPDSQAARALYHTLGFQTEIEVAAAGPDGTPRVDLLWRARHDGSLEREALAKLVQWLRSERSGDPHALFTNDIDWDTGLTVHEGDEFFAALAYTAPLVDVEVIDQVIGREALALVFHARDPVTNLWHRVALSATLVGNRIGRVRGASGAIPPPT